MWAYIEIMHCASCSWEDFYSYYILSICAQNLKKRLKETKSATMNVFRKKNLFFLNHL